MNDKQTGIIRLINSDDPLDISTDLGVSYGTVIRWKNELTKAQKENKVNALLALDTAVLEDMASSALTDVPDSILPSVQEAASGLVSGLTGLQRLDSELQTTASFINTRIKSLAMTAESVGEISELTEALCSLQGAFFGKGTQVNIQNNIGGSDTYGEFLNDAPGQ